MVFVEPICLPQQLSMPGDHHSPQCSLEQLTSAWHRGGRCPGHVQARDLSSVLWFSECAWQVDDSAGGEAAAPTGLWEALLRGPCRAKLPSWVGPAAVFPSAWAAAGKLLTVELLN